MSTGKRCTTGSWAAAENNITTSTSKATKDASQLFNFTHSPQLSSLPEVSAVQACSAVRHQLTRSRNSALTMSETTVPKPSTVVARPVSEALLNEKVQNRSTNSPNNPMLGLPPTPVGCLLTSHVVGSLPIELHHQIHPRSRFRRRLLSPPVQAESMACLRRHRFRSRTGVRGVQLQPQAGVERDQEAGMRAHRQHRSGEEIDGMPWT